VPSVSKKQERFMQAVAHNKAFAKKVGVPQSVGREFTKSGGGEMRGEHPVQKKSLGGAKMVKMAKGGKAMAKKEIEFMQKKGAPKSMIKHEKAEYGMKKGGYAMGGPLGAKPSGLSYPQKTPKPPKGGPNVDTFPPSKSKPSGVGGMLNSLNKLSQNASGRVMPLPPGSGRGFPVKPTPSVGSGRGPIKPLPPGSGRGFPVKPDPRMKSGGSVKKMQSGGKADAPAPRVSMPSVEIAGGQLEPARVGKGYGVKWTKKFAGGGMTAGHKAADGIAKKGRTQTKMVKMMGGGKC